ncbi:D-alanyl-D-alanine carboxypeptidase family protein [Pontibacillus marinus]|uniref:D-alanyl-D-alanine carboxypeptidase n=1 Tax=Pontibacillus marinus BH030004 = DSM 16465 TaxID=1385511 RepID=A0A0A5G0M0_9BACI|nr:D-alanyl-D-alanine carboxypeptidase family protein [Pontibacillus marinus]KGX84605.1 D-alanyl-D-alanine carboxypeptidase [Pontibacillus marinus BH030004 = DSM 16465]
MKKQFSLIITMIFFIFLISIPKTIAQPDPLPPEVNSEAVILIESNSGKVLYTKNAGKEMYPASLTKIATAIYAIEKGNLDEMVTVTKEARSIEGTRVYLDEGEKVTLKKLLQGLLINSGNDAGVAIAQHMSGSEEQFAADLNEYLTSEVGVENTTFANPHGLFDPKHVTTAKDLVKITQYAMKNEVFRELFGTKSLKWDGEAWDTTLYTHHKLMREDPYEGITGGKTGYVDESGFTLATSAKRNNLSLIVITLNSERQSIAYEDTKKLLDYGFDNFKISSFSKGEEFYVTHPVQDQLMYGVSNGEMLNVINDAEKVQGISPLIEMKNKKDDKQYKSLTSNSKEEEDDSSLMASLSIIIVLLLLMVFCFILYKTKLSKENFFKRS